MSNRKPIFDNRKLALIPSFFNGVYANNIDAFIPELWANESIAILEENMVAGINN